MTLPTKPSMQPVRVGIANGLKDWRATEFEIYPAVGSDECTVAGIHHPNLPSLPTHLTSDGMLGTAMRSIHFRSSISRP